MLNFMTECKVTRCSDAVAAGTDDFLVSDGIEMGEFRGCMFLVALGELTALGTFTVKIEFSDDDGDADAYAALDGSSVVVTDANSGQTVLMEVREPIKAWARINFERADENAVLDGITAIQHSPRKFPVVQGEDVLAGVYAKGDVVIAF